MSLREENLVGESDLSVPEERLAEFSASNTDEQGPETDDLAPDQLDDIYGDEPLELVQ